MHKEIQSRLIQLLQPKLERFQISESELTAGFDLVKSGFVNSLEFVELVTGLEKHFGIEISFEDALEKGDFTTFGGLLRTIEKYYHG